jgi:hypothetical protein
MLLVYPFLHQKGDMGGHQMTLNTTGGHPAMDYNEHQRTYAGFLKATQLGIAFLVLLLAGMAFFLL